VPEISDPGGYRVVTVDRMLARAAFRGGIPGVDERTLDRLVDRAIGLFEAGDVHAARAVLYLATPDPATAARALATLNIRPPHPQPYSRSGGGLGRLLAPPVQAQTVGWDETYRDLRGRLRGLYWPVPVVWPPGVCEHSETMCPQCLDTWAEDYALALFDHGPDGAEAGCLCVTCQTATNPDPTSDPDLARPDEPHAAALDDTPPTPHRAESGPDQHGPR
jgi:hypothetical protein